MWNDALTYGRLNEDIIIQKWFNYPFDTTCLKEYQKGRKVIISSATDTYADIPYSLTPLKKTYCYIPEIRDEIVTSPYGVSLHLWSEVISNNTNLEKMIFPRIEAFGENAWLENDKLDYRDFLIRLRKELSHLNSRGIIYTNLDSIDSFSFKELSQFLNNKITFKNYTSFSVLALLKMCSEYRFERNSNKKVRKKI